MKTDIQPRLRRWGVRLLVVMLSLGLHGVLVLWLLDSRCSHRVAPVRGARALGLVGLPEREAVPLPEPEPEPEPEPGPEPLPEPVRTPQPERQSRPAPRPAA